MVLLDGINAFVSHVFFLSHPGRVAISRSMFRYGASERWGLGASWSLLEPLGAEIRITNLAADVFDFPGRQTPLQAGQPGCNQGTRPAGQSLGWQVTPRAGAGQPGSSQGPRIRGPAPHPRTVLDGIKSWGSHTRGHVGGCDKTE